jgi:HEAT repeat protein
MADLLRGSPTARDELAAMVMAETDPLAKHQLVESTRQADPRLREELALKLAASADPETRRMGVDILPRIGTREAFDQLVDRAGADSDVDVRRAAVKAITTFQSRDMAAVKSGATNVNEVLRSVIATERDPEIRRDAFRGLVGHGTLTQQDREFIRAYADGEGANDPMLRAMALKAQTALDRRSRRPK